MKKDEKMTDFWIFETVITPYIVIIVYGMGVFLLPLLLYVLAKKLSLSLNTRANRAIFIVLIVFTELFWRILNEFIIVYFKIYQTLQ